MPFTLAHPALILPLRKYKLSLTALIAGSIVPDFEFFFQMREVDNIGHHWYGVILFDVPMAVVLCILYHNVLRRPLIANLPNFFKARILNSFMFNWNHFAIHNKLRILLSILIGIATHLIWDGFTHADGFVVEMLPALSGNISFYTINIPIYYFLQILFSICGIGVVIISLFKAPKLFMTSEMSACVSWYWPIFTILSAAIFFIRIVGWPQYNSFWGMVMAFIGSLCYALILVSFLEIKFKSVYLYEN
ncbi:MAG: DUF4184 family protein [Niabella sp.]